MIRVALRPFGVPVVDGPLNVAGLFAVLARRAHHIPTRFFRRLPRVVIILPPRTRDRLLQSSFFGLAVRSCRAGLAAAAVVG